LILVLGLFVTHGCNYYKPLLSASSTPTAKSKEIEAMGQKTFIVRSDRGDFLLKNVNIRLEEEELVGVLETVPEQFRTYIDDTKSKYKYKSGDPSVLSEVHLYTILDDSAKLGDTVTIPISNVTKMETIQRDKSRSTTNTFWTVVGVSAVAFAMFITISIIVYVYD
jgi:hypothetical protein